MKVSEYHKQGLKHFIEEPKDEWKKIGEAKEGAHRVAFYLTEDGKCVFNSSRRCRKLLAIADFTCDFYNREGRFPTQEEILNFFAEERDREKMKARIDIVSKALKG